MDVPENKIREYTRRIMLARMKLLCNNGFYGLLLMHVKMGLGTENETAWIEDGSKIMFNPSFIEKLSDNELEYALMHEVLHIALKHLERSGNSSFGTGGIGNVNFGNNGSGSDREDLYGQAADIVVNSNILRANGGNESSIYLRNFGGVQPHMVPNGNEGWKYSVEEVFSFIGGHGGTAKKDEDDEDRDSEDEDYENEDSENEDFEDEGSDPLNDDTEDKNSQSNENDDHSQSNSDGKDSRKDSGTGGESEDNDSETGNDNGQNEENDRNEKKGENGNNGKNGNNGGSGNSRSNGTDNNSMNGKSDKAGNKGNGQAGSNGDGSCDRKRNGSGWDTHKFVVRDEKAQKIQDEQWKAYICQACEAMAKQFKNLEIDPDKDGNSYGLIPGFAERLMEELKNPQVDWRTVLQEFVQEEITDYSFMPPDRRFGDSPFFLPDYNEKDDKVEKILFMVDTSGSMSRKTITAVYSEIKGAIDQFNGRLQGWLGFFDAAVVEPAPFEDEEEFMKIKPAGGGGTRFDIIFKYVEEYMYDDPPVSIVVLTDGIAPFPDESCTNGIPVLWVLTTDVTPPWGKIARIEIE
ncbi:MAG: hypothetical protein J5824_07925 [Lachnospiraceae bacterium]|nr:hypothetical protein [Lachnospiraceae bacterium]